ncbi:hypothetical protein CALCODRAFT_557485 [Calocera cornea HHB12733]|uniref:SET domain-containing protein n=1 Tax=Calocera cornea HHB12733 TaxID=1353952 RepID=A0A165DTG3_9BASI|nr:hypothetical protein CALCODRAFT_557485 [Calocera cornea HHB12733]
MDNSAERRPLRELTDAALWYIYDDKRQHNAALNTINVDNAIARLRHHRRDLASRAVVAVAAPAVVLDSAKVPAKVPAEGLRAAVGNKEWSYVWRLDQKADVPQSESHSTLNLNGILPAPSYETCPPASCNHLLEWHDGESVDFAPFPDDPSFDLDEYMQYIVDDSEDDGHTKEDEHNGEAGSTQKAFRKELAYKYLSRNVGDDQTIRDTADEVMQQYNIDVHTLKRFFLAIFFLDKSEYHNIMRGAPFYEEWMNLSSRLDAASVSSLEEWTGGFVQKHYCPVPDCRRPDCAHVRARTRLGLSWNAPTPDAGMSVQEPLQPCENSCYLLDDMEGTDELEHWDGLTLAILKDAVKSFPDAPSCDLAIWCRTSCRQFELQRARLPSMQDSLPSRPRRPGKATYSREVANKIAKAAMKPEEQLGYPFSVPCSHEGLCNQRSNCLCFRSDKRCEKWCGCRMDCNRKHGCSCGPKACNVKNCVCYKEGRECDLSVCHGGRHKLGAQYVCCNVTLQEGKRPSVTVKPATWGWGLFADEAIRKDQFIGEYFGEFMTCEREGREYAVATFIGRTYGFAANKKWSINSANIGNETRFMNHSSKPNVVARHWKVNGDARIGFYTVAYIAKGGELFLDYGSDFWQNASKKS